jgi:KipI family sensor histidine kinase inhibitor
VKVYPYGESAVLAEAEGTDQVLALRAAAEDVPGITELVPADRTLLVAFDARATNARRVERALRAASLVGRPAGTGPTVQLAVSYDGADLASLAAELGLTVGEIVQRHCEPQYTVAFCGFSPGFAYLRGLDPVLHVARLPQPRTSVPAGSVAIAGEFGGVYPRSSPGGWRLLGRTDASLWDAQRDPPALLTPGAAVRFHPA